jgi:predicted phosphoribosyltransferase
MGAIASGGVRVISREIVDEIGISDAAIDSVAAREAMELERRERLYRDDRVLPPLDGKTVIIVDDGLATGATMEAAIAAIRQLHAARVVAAAPVGARESCGRLAAMADDVVCAEMPAFFHAVGQWYVTFDQTTDDEVIELLRQRAIDR